MSKKNTVKELKEVPFFYNNKLQTIVYLALLTIILLFVNKDNAIKGLYPQGTDVIGSLGKTNIVREFQDKTDKDPFWNPAIFAGMPHYINLAPKAFSVDTLLTIIGKFFGSIFIFYLFGAIGIFLLLKQLKIPLIGAFAVALMFVLLPHYDGLWLEGHFKKFRAIMYIPWVLLAFKYFLDKRNLLSMALFALAFGVQIRTSHYQIIFYTAALVFAVGVAPFLKEILNKDYKTFAKSFGLLLTALILALSMSAQPLFLNKEYLPYSKRGKTTINLKEKKTVQKETGGVSMEYATQWSTYPLELTRLIIPHAYGGVHGEIYKGDEFPQLKGKQLPNYWGFMPFHTLFDYLGVLTLILAVIGIVGYRKDGFVKSLGFFSLFLFLLSFGRHFEFFYSIFYNYFPYFNKFRAPSMSITVNFFILTVLAGYGLKYLFSIRDEKNKEQKSKEIFYVLGGFAILGIILWATSGSLAYMKANEGYNAQVLNILKSVRKSLYQKDLLRYFVLLVISSALIYGLLKNKLKYFYFGIIVALITVIDLMNVAGNYNKELKDLSKIEKQYFTINKVEEFLTKDKELFRIFPVGRLMGDNRWAYRFQSIGGYSPIKMYAIEELVENCYYGGPNKQLPINWNVLKFLNVKYLVTDQQILDDRIKLVSYDTQKKLFAYEFEGFNKRAFFVDSVKVIKDEYDRLRYINSAEFDADKIAILEEEISEKIDKPDSSIVEVKSYNPNRIELEVYTDKQSLLVISEVFYPPAWKILIDGKEVEKIYKTNHAVQAVVIPAGVHEVSVICSPDSFFKYRNIAIASVSIIYLIIWGSLGITLFKKRLI